MACVIRGKVMGTYLINYVFQTKSWPNSSIVISSFVLSLNKNRIKMPHPAPQHPRRDVTRRDQRAAPSKHIGIH